ncbi:PH domain-containing protein [Nakamurella sp. YIM 132087]|uniref:PH domain-containing protein n=1 Tax=Nakamurella alba TaxID=2665158 RepID=A0A7K1FIY5_9ACTN|nr:PH domain-containing protein [Nakamurella alba]MTD14077.1 PH domain-containing protein [Nakamurella alba]
MSRHQGVLLTVRPRRMTIYASISAAVVVIAMVIVGIALRNSEAGISFRVADQIALVGLGVLIGAGILLMARPRLQVTEQGLWVRNVLGERFFEWELAHRIAFPEGANWAQLQLPDDEVHAVMAIQAMDRQRAVTALQAARELRERFAGPPPAPPARDEALFAAESSRPLGRLEKIDRIKAAQGAQQRDSRPGR